MSEIVARSADDLLVVSELTVEFDTPDGVVHAVTDLSFRLETGETLAILGESGSGKSVSVQAIMGLVPSPPGRIAAGSVRYRGTELVGAGERELRDVRGPEMAMIFQDPLTSLNPCGGWAGRSLRPSGSMAACRPVRRAAGPWSCSTGSGSPIPVSGPTNTHTSSRAACASGR